jgi:hypothetical protein
VIEYSNDLQRCVNCNKDDACCCLAIHIMKDEDCCNDISCENSDRQPRSINILNRKSLPLKEERRQDVGLRSFFLNAKSLYAAALGIEILCIAAAEIGENAGLYLFGFTPLGIVIAFVMGYSLAGFTTFVAILGRYGSRRCGIEKDTGMGAMDSCCSVLEQDSTQGFVSNLKTTFANFAVGSKRLVRIRNQQGLKKY